MSAAVHARLREEAKRSMSVDPVNGRSFSLTMPMRVQTMAVSGPHSEHHPTTRGARPLRFGGSVQLPARSSSIAPASDELAAATSWQMSPRLNISRAASPPRPLSARAHASQQDEAELGATAPRSSRMCQVVQRWLAAHPEVAAEHCFRCKDVAECIWELDGHDVQLELQQAPLQPAVLLVVDGPLKQPLSDYLSRTEANAFYDSRGIARTSALHHVPKERRMTFGDENASASRLEAMRIAKTQAAIREKAADYTRGGQLVPVELQRAYRQCMRAEPSQPPRTEPLTAACVSPDQPQDGAPSVRGRSPVKTATTLNVSCRLISDGMASAPSPPAAPGPGAPQPWGGSVRLAPGPPAAKQVRLVGVTTPAPAATARVAVACTACKAPPLVALAAAPPLARVVARGRFGGA